jgi:streptothricin acetyltransferase
MHVHKVIIRRGDPACLDRLAQCDFSFEITADIPEPFNGEGTVPVEPPYRKSYNYNVDELAKYLESSEGAFFVAEVDGSTIGYVAVSRGWNNYAVIEDIAVDSSQRRNGVARLLMDVAVGWAREAALAGVRLETQSNNVAACRFYERYGFVLGGYDRYLYRAMHPGTREIALFWYLLFPHAV